MQPELIFQRLADLQVRTSLPAPQARGGVESRDLEHQVSPMASQQHCRISESAHHVPVFGHSGQNLHDGLYGSGFRRAHVGQRFQFALLALQAPRAF